MAQEKAERGDVGELLWNWNAGSSRTAICNACQTALPPSQAGSSPAFGRVTLPNGISCYLQFVRTVRLAGWLKMRIVRQNSRRPRFWALAPAGRALDPCGLAPCVGLLAAPPFQPLAAV